MLPSDFLQEYGTVKVVTHTLTNGVWGELLPDPYRYLIVFPPLSNAIPYHVQPIIDAGNELFAYTVDNASTPLIFTHALHGSLVGSGWRVKHTQVGQTITISILVGRMQPAQLTGGNENEHQKSY